MTTANKITVGRILMIPGFIYLLLRHREEGADWLRWSALMCFALVAVLDGVDGYVARRYQQRSELGAVLDPLADKLLLVSALILLSLDKSYLGAVSINDQGYVKSDLTGTTMLYNIGAPRTFTFSVGLGF